MPSINDQMSFFVLGELDMIKKHIADQIEVAFPNNKVFINQGNDMRLPYNHTDFPHCILYISAMLCKKSLLRIASIKKNSASKIILITDEQTGPKQILNSIGVEATYSINKPIEGLFNLIQQSISDNTINHVETYKIDDISQINESSLSNLRLTSTESQVFTLLKTGMSNKEIANMTKKSEGTVKVQLKSIYKKLNIHSRTEAMSLFIS